MKLIYKIRGNTIKFRENKHKSLIITIIIIIIIFIIIIIINIYI